MKKKRFRSHARTPGSRFASVRKTWFSTSLELTEHGCRPEQQQRDAPDPAREPVLGRAIRVRDDHAGHGCRIAARERADLLHQGFARSWQRRGRDPQQDQQQRRE